MRKLVLYDKHIHKTTRLNGKDCNCKISYQFMEFMPDHQKEKDEGKWKAEPGNKDALRVQVALWNKNLRSIPKIQQSKIS